MPKLPNKPSLNPITDEQIQKYQDSDLYTVIHRLLKKLKDGEITIKLFCILYSI
jgi:hypothetical protein